MDSFLVYLGLGSSVVIAGIAVCQVLDTQATTEGGIKFLQFQSNLY